MNITLNDTNPVQITGLTADKDYFIQGFYKPTNTLRFMAADFELFKGEPQENEIGLKDDYFALTANADIYVKALSVPTYIVVVEC